MCVIVQHWHLILQSVSAIYGKLFPVFTIQEGYLCGEKAGQAVSHIFLPLDMTIYCPLKAFFNIVMFYRASLKGFVAHPCDFLGRLRKGTLAAKHSTDCDAISSCGIQPRVNHLLSLNTGWHVTGSSSHFFNCMWDIGEIHIAIPGFLLPSEHWVDSLRLLNTAQFISTITQKWFEPSCFVRWMRNRIFWYPCFGVAVWPMMP